MKPVGRIGVPRATEDHLLLQRGKVSLQQLELLMKGASITGEGVRAAMVDHLVRGKGKSESAERNRIYPSQVTRALKSLNQANRMFAGLAPFYMQQQPAKE